MCPWGCIDPLCHINWIGLRSYYEVYWTHRFRKEWAMRSRRKKQIKTSSKSSVGAKNKSKQEWIAFYAKRILNCWQGFQSPFGVSQNYINEIQVQLSSFYDIPEERVFIELSYRKQL